MIIISNGHHKFITGPAAVEAAKKGLLAGFITAGYPTPKIRRLLVALKLTRFASVNRLLKRREELPDSIVYSLWFSEIIYLFVRYIARHLPRLEYIVDYGLQVYAWQAKRIVRKLPARLYHYRGGYGHASVEIAKQRGMITLCDFSIAHPLALDYLIANGGRLPSPGQSGPANRMWLNILEDAMQAEFLLLNSDFVKKTFTHFGWDASRLFVLYTGVDDQFLSLVPARSFPSLTDKPIKILFAGDMGARKGGRILLESLCRIGDLAWEFEAIGAIDKDLKQDFRKLFSEERVTVTGHLPWVDLATHMSRADLFVFPSLAEGSARVIFMAMACGCYVVTTPNSGSIVQDGVHGNLVDPGDVDALERALRDCFRNREKIPGVGQKNANLIKTQYTQRHYGNELLSIYSKLLAH